MLCICLLLSACDQSKDEGQQTVRELTGSQMIQQEQQMKQKLEQARQQHEEQLRQLDQ